MATNFPTSIDSFTNPTSGDTLDSPSHAAQHTNVNDAMVAVQTRLGTGSGTIGTWTTWTPTFTGVTAQPATIQAQYSQVNDLVFWAVYFAFGGAGTVNGSLRLTAPVTGTSVYQDGYFVNGQSWMRPDGTTIFMGMTLAIGTNIWLYAPQRLASDYIQGSDNVNASTPDTWTSSGSAWLTGWYQAA